MKSLNFKKISFFSFGLILIVAFSAFLVKKNLSDPRIFSPVLAFEQEKLDLGEVEQGPKVNGEFQFTNKGMNVLTIKNIIPSCGCTGVVEDDKRDYQPGESGKIRFTFNTEGRSGKNDKTITVESNDSKEPKKFVMFTVNILTPTDSKK